MWFLYFLGQAFVLHKEVGIPDPATGALSSSRLQCVRSVVLHSFFSFFFASFPFNSTAFHHVELLCLCGLHQIQPVRIQSPHIITQFRTLPRYFSSPFPVSSLLDEHKG